MFLPTQNQYHFPQKTKLHDQSHINMITILKDQVFSYDKDRIQDPTVNQKI